MKILGIHDGYNASVCLLENGKMIFAVQEERLRRIKNYFGFPSMAISAALKFANLRPIDINYIALSGYYQPKSKTREQILEDYRRRINNPSYRFKKVIKKSMIAKIYKEKRLRERINNLLDFGFEESQIEVVEHHLCHASSAYYGYGKFDEPILVITNDGDGDDLCATISIGQNGIINRISEVNHSESIGHIYALVTFMLGMVPLEHEYKLMGMAPYADSKGILKVYDILMNMFEFDSSDPLKFKRRSNIPETFYSYSYLKKKLERIRFDLICGGVQKFIEDILTCWIRNAINKTGINKIVLGGGVFMNVKANKNIMEIPEVKELFVYPSCSDESNSMGAAYNVYSRKGSYRDIKPLKDLYLSNSYKIDKFEKLIRNNGIEVQEIGDIESKIAILLANNKIVARFSGRAEFGARALGNRSILSNPSNIRNVKIINEAIKSRDFWMPFACSIAEDYETNYINNYKKIKAPYMILTFDSTKNVNEIIAGVHPYDLTVRPQIVYKGWNEGYYNIIKHFKKLTDIGGILNTSFNLHGYPIVEKPEDSLKVFEKAGLEYLAIENFLFSKKK